jgi:solute carrier family 15 (oligopeptide transporter), member 1
LTQKLLFHERDATVLFHVFGLSVYFCCVFGAIIADSFWGKFKTILCLSIVYVAGSLIITVGSIKDLNLPAGLFTLIGLFLIALGSGGIKPCVAAFGGEQFKLPEQQLQVARFFGMFYFAINLGSFISTMVTPILRNDVKCFGEDDCFPAGFGLPAVLMMAAVVIFIAGKPLYKVVSDPTNMFAKVCACVKVSKKVFNLQFSNISEIFFLQTAIAVRRKEKLSNPREHWIDYAEEKHGKRIVMEIKIVLHVLVLYLPLPLFWALFEQQGSRWTFQAKQMDGDLGFYVVKPDQMQVANSFMILVFIPVFQYVIYPLLKLIKIERPLQKMAFGGVMAGVAFVASMFVEQAIFHHDRDHGAKISILWQLPQYAIMTMAEVNFQIFSKVLTFQLNFPSGDVFYLRA